MNEVTGNWNLLSFEITSREGNVSRWRDRSSSGILIYTEDGKMSVAINSEVSKFSSLRDPEEILQSCLFYAGTYKVCEEIIEHHVQFATNPNRISQIMTRRYELSHSQLTLYGDGGYGTSKLVWTR